MEVEGEQRGHTANHNYGVLIESFRKPGILVLFLTYFGLVVVALIAGLAGPAVLSEQDRETGILCPDANCTAHWRGSLVNMNKLHQIMFLEAAVSKPTMPDVGFEYRQEIVVSAFGIDSDNNMVPIAENKHHTRVISCPVGTIYCSNIVVFHQSFIHYPSYEVDVEFRHALDAFGQSGVNGILNVDFTLHRINRSFTTFEISVKYTLVFISLLFAGLFLVKMCGVPRAAWTFEQRWIAALLVLLILFDNPLIALDIFNPSLVWTGISTVLAVSFMAAMLMFWLCVVDVVRSASAPGGQSFRGVWFYLPKTILITLFWFSSLSIYMYSRLQQTEDPAYNAADDLDNFPFFKVLAFVIIGIYVIWLAILSVMAFAEICRMSLHFRAVFGLSLATIIISLLGLLLGAYSPFPLNSLLFMLFYSVYNIYIWLISIAYLPYNMAEDEEEELELRHDDELGMTFDNIGYGDAQSPQRVSTAQDFTIDGDSDDEEDGQGSDSDGPAAVARS